MLFSCLRLAKTYGSWLIRRGAIFAASRTLCHLRDVKALAGIDLREQLQEAAAAPKFLGGHAKPGVGLQREVGLVAGEVKWPT